MNQAYLIGGGILALIAIAWIVSARLRARKIQELTDHLTQRGYRIVEDKRAVAQENVTISSAAFQGANMPGIFKFLARLAMQRPRIVFAAERQTSAGRIVVYWGTYRQSTGEDSSSTPVSGAMLTPNAELPIFIVNLQQRALVSLGSSKGQLETGDADFDRNAYVSTTEPDRVRAMLTPEARSAIAQLRRPGHVACSGTGLLVETARRPRPEDLDAYAAVVEAMASPAPGQTSPQEQRH